MLSHNASITVADMIARRVLLLFSACLASSLAAAENIEFTGVMVEGTRVKIALREKASTASRWLSPGESFLDYSFKAYDATSESVVLVKNGAETKLRLVDAKTRNDANSTKTPQAPAYHIVKPGDTGLKVAQAQGISVRDLQALNGGVDFSRLKVGQSLRVR